MFDTNGLVKRPEYPVIEAQNKKQGRLHIKTIAKPKEISYIINPHCCFFKHKQVAVDENFQEIGNPYKINAFTKKHSTDKIAINHYHVKSFEYYIRKILIGLADSKNKRDPFSSELYFESYERDYKTHKYLPKLKICLK